MRLAQRELEGAALQDRKLFDTILGVTATWHVVRVELKTDEERVDLWLDRIRRGSYAQTAALIWPFVIAPRTEHGVIWTHASHTCTCIRQFRALTVQPMARKQVCVPWAEPGSRLAADGVVDHRSDPAVQYGQGLAQAHRRDQLGHTAVQDYRDRALTDARGGGNLAGASTRLVTTEL